MFTSEEWSTLDTVDRLVLVLWLWLWLVYVEFGVVITICNGSLLTSKADPCVCVCVRACVCTYMDGYQVCTLIYA